METEFTAWFGVVVFLTVLTILTAVVIAISAWQERGVVKRRHWCSEVRTSVDGWCVPLEDK